MSFQTVLHESGQTGLFFGSSNELNKYTEHHNNASKAKIDYIMAPAKDFLTTHTADTPSTFTQRFKANVTAIEVLNALRSRNSAPTRKEQSKLSLYSGWGAVSQVFDEANTKLKEKREQVKSLLSDQEYSSARASTISAFYTPFYLSRGIYDLLEKAGFKSGKICDTSAGVGGLISPMPDAMYTDSEVTLVELDNLSSEILEHLYPNATIYGGKGFEQLNLKSSQDLVIQNPPFGAAKVFDKFDSSLSGLSLHNYFICKGLKALRDGGLMAAIVTTSFFDSKSTKAREIAANLADLKGAIRLPKEVFLNHSGANASVDVLLFQRSSSACASNANWVTCTEKPLAGGESYLLNDYFVQNPSAVLGSMEIQKGLQAKQVQCVSNSVDLVSDVKHALNSHFPADIYSKCEQVECATFVEPIHASVTGGDYIAEGGYAITDDGQIAVRKGDYSEQPVFEVMQALSSKREQRIKAMVKVKEVFNNLLTLERDDKPDADIENCRLELNAVYDAFVAKNGYLQETANRRAFGTDPFYANLASLEVDFQRGVTKEQAKRLNVKPVKPSASKAEIFSERIIKPWVMPTTASNPIDAMWLVWNYSNEIDLNKIAALCNENIYTVKNALVGSFIFKNPETSKFEFAESYLSGDVKRKLSVVESLIQSLPELVVNYDALKKVQPKHIPAVDISVELNAGWLPSDVVKEFIKQLLECRVDAEHTLGQWHVNLSGVASLVDTKQYGIADYPASKIIPRLYANKSLIVRTSLPSGGTLVNKEATLQVEGIATEIKARFEDWVWSCPTRRERLENIYNEQFNRHVRPVYSGEMLEFPDQSMQIELRPHQKTCVRRSLEQGSLLLDIAVGGGKTFTIASIVHSWHRLGIKNRTAVVLPNHLVQQIAIEWLRLYPLEKLLVLAPEDMSASKRRETLNRIKTGAKIVLIPESTFKAIPLPAESEKLLIEEEIAEARNAMELLGDKFSVKRIETKLRDLEFNLEQLTNRKSKDETLDFGELGFDSLCVDESHGYKNLCYNTAALANVRGMGNPKGSQRAWDLFVKTRYLNQKYDHAGIVFSTGTPISNSIIELFTLQKFLCYDDLKAQNMHWLDTWADLFASCTTEFEIDATGAGFKPVTRLRQFINLSELQAKYACIAETVTKAQLDDFLPKLEGGYNLIPPLAGGKPNTIFVEPSNEQFDFIQNNLVGRAKNFKLSPIENDNMLLLMFHARCASLDLRILDPLASENPNSKARACADEVIKIHRKYENVKGTQLIFCDLSTPNKGKEKLRKQISDLKVKAAQGDDAAVKELEAMGSDQVFAAESNFSVYEDIKAKLIEGGIPEHEIAFAQDYKTPKAKEEFYLQINNGVKRVVIASTAVMGTGANVNKLAVAVHHLDPTYKPSCMTQRSGRVERQGNLIYQSNPRDFDGIIVNYYATKQSLDAYLYQVLQNKSSWIESFRSFKSNERKISDISGDTMTFAEIKAEVSGNYLLLELLKVKKEVERLSFQQKRHQQQQHQYEGSIKKLTQDSEDIADAVENIKKDMARFEANKLPKGVFSAVVGGYQIDKFTTAGELLLQELKNFRFNKAESVEVMRYCGFVIDIESTFRGYEFVIRANHAYRTTINANVQKSPNTIISTVVNLLKGLYKQLEWQQRLLNETQINLKTASAELGKPFNNLEALIAAKVRLNEIKHELMESENNTVGQAA